MSECVCVLGDQEDSSGRDENGDGEWSRHETWISDHLHLQVIQTGGQVP